MLGIEMQTPRHFRFISRLSRLYSRTPGFIRIYLFPLLIPFITSASLFSGLPHNVSNSLGVAIVIMTFIQGLLLTYEAEFRKNRSRDRSALKQTCDFFRDYNSQPFPKAGNPKARLVFVCNWLSRVMSTRLSSDIYDITDVVVSILALDSNKGAFYSIAQSNLTNLGGSIRQLQEIGIDTKSVAANVWNDNRRRYISISDTLEAEKTGDFFFIDAASREYLKSIMCYKVVDGEELPICIICMDANKANTFPDHAHKSFYNSIGILLPYFDSIICHIYRYYV